MRLPRTFFAQTSSPVLIFDKDGTLVDTESLYFEAFNRLLAPFGREHDLLTHARMMGAPTNACLAILHDRHPGFPGEEAFPRLRDELFGHLAEVRRKRGLRIMPGAANLLAHCREQGFRTAMATSATRENTERDLEELGWRRYFEAIVTADDVSRHKPAPDVFLEAARRLGVSPENCTAIEDGPRGVQSAHAAGMRVIFVRDARFGITPPVEATLVVASLDELLD